MIGEALVVRDRWKLAETIKRRASRIPPGQEAPWVELAKNVIFRKWQSAPVGERPLNFLALRGAVAM